MIRTNICIKLITSVLLTALTALAQSSDRLPVTDAEKMGMHCAPALHSSPRTRHCSIGLWRLEVNTGFFVKARTNGPVCRVFPGIITTSQGVSTQYSCGGYRTALPGAHPKLKALASPTLYRCMGAGYLWKSARARSYFPRRSSHHDRVSAQESG